MRLTVHPGGIRKLKEMNNFMSIVQPNLGKPCSGYAPKYIKARLLGQSEDELRKQHPMQKVLGLNSRSSLGLQKTTSSLD